LDRRVDARERGLGEAGAAAADAGGGLHPLYGSAQRPDRDAQVELATHHDLSGTEEDPVV
jgi:hypothetical protein